MVCGVLSFPFKQPFDPRRHYLAYHPEYVNSSDSSTAYLAENARTVSKKRKTAPLHDTVRHQAIPLN